MTNLIDQINAASLREDIPAFRAGDTVKVHVKVIEGNRSRVQVFQGVVIARNGGSTLGATYTVRKISFGVGVERTFPLHTPTVEKVEVVTRGDVRAPSCTTYVSCVVRLPRFASVVRPKA